MNSNLVDCIPISVDCMKATEKEKKLYGVNAWGFDFYVRESEASNIMYYIITRLSEYSLPILNVNLGKLVKLRECDIWSKETIETCISNNMGFLLEAENQTLKK
jgi:hypothetical protein